MLAVPLVLLQLDPETLQVKLRREKRDGIVLLVAVIHDQERTPGSFIDFVIDGKIIEAHLVRTVLEKAWSPNSRTITHPEALDGENVRMCHPKLRQVGGPFRIFSGHRQVAVKIDNHRRRRRLH